MQGIADHVSLRLPAKLVQFQQAAATQIACMAGVRLIPPTPGRKVSIAFFSTSSMRGEQGMQAEEVKECENQPSWWIWAQTCRKGMWSKRISGRKEGIGSRSNVAQG
jgi:hypothetical protein